MNVLDLFSGACGGWSLGLHRAGFRTVAACEADPWRRNAFSSNFPGIPVYDDVRTLTAERLRADGVPRIRVIAGSPPCQDASTANTKGKGIDGERTGLFFEAVRLVRELRPDWVCLENVPGLRTRGYDRVQDELEAAGYAVWPLVVGAVHAGAPHRRNRVWIICRNLAAEPAQEQVGRAGQPWGEAGRVLAPDASEIGIRQPKLPSGPEPQAPASSQSSAGCHADAAPMLGPSIARREPDGIAEGLAPDASEPIAVGRGAPRGRSGRTEADAGVGPVADADETGQRTQPPALGCSLEQAEGQAPERNGLALQQWSDWNGGPPDLGRVDAGLPKGLARPSLAAFGDAVVPQITEQIGRAILAAEGLAR